MQRWKLHFFRIFRCICFGVVAFVFVCFPFFFRKKNARVDQSCKKNATEKMQRRKLQKNAAEKMQRWKLHFLCIFRSVIFGICIFRCIFRFSGFATTSLVVLLGVLTGAYVAYRRRHSDESWCQKTHRSGTAWLTACLPFFWTISKLETSNLTKLLHFGVV